MTKIVKKFKKTLCMLTAFSVLFLSSCGQPKVITYQETPIKISFSWWGNDTRTEYTLEAIHHFEKLHPEIKVECNYAEWNGYEKRYNIAMLSSSEADVMQINYAWITQYSPDGTNYYDINSLSDTVNLSNFSKEELDYGIKGEHLNAIPIALNTMTIYINKSIFDSYGLDIPVTWQDYFDAAKIMNGEVYPLGVTAKPAMFMCISYTEQVTGHQFMDMDGKITFTEEDFVIMFNFYKSLIENKVIPQVQYFEKNDITSGKYAGFMAWVSDGTSYTTGALDKGYEYIVAPYPTLDGKSKLTGWYAKPATMYAISVNTKHPKEAALLLNYLLNSTDMADYQGIEKGIPLSDTMESYMEINGSLSGLQYEAHLQMMDSIDNMNIISPYFENAQILDEFKQSGNNVIFNKSTAEEEAAAFLEKIKKIKY